jgi:hypothetical protein
MGISVDVTPRGTNSVEVIELSKRKNTNPGKARVPLIWEGFPEEIEQLIFLMSREQHARNHYCETVKLLSVEWHYHIKYRKLAGKGGIDSLLMGMWSPHPGRVFLTTKKKDFPRGWRRSHNSLWRCVWDPRLLARDLYDNDAPQVCGVLVEELSTRKNSTLQRVLQQNTKGTVKGLKKMTKATLVKAILNVE